MGKSIGIDLGTTNSVVAFKDATVKIVKSNENEELTRSCVALEEGEFLVGTRTYRNMTKYTPNAIISIKRLMGASIDDKMVKQMIANYKYYPFGITKLSSGTNEAVAVVLRGKEYTPEQISAEILRYLKNYASEKIGEVTHAVITVPAYFNEKQKTATRIAANLAGLKVQRLLSEPTAAAISYGINNLHPDESKVVLIYDFGGGTFDISILVIANGQFIESGTGGDRWLGGDDIDRLLQQYVNSKISQQYSISNIDELLKRTHKRKQNKFIDEMRKQIEDAKKQLTVAKNAKIELYGFLESEAGDDIDIEVSISRSEFDGLIRPLVERTIKLIDELLETSGYPIETIDNILLVGGSSCIPLVKQMLSEKYGREKVLSSENPMLAIAEGAAILAHALSEEFECPKCGAKIKPKNVVCAKCGTNVENITSAPNEQVVDVVHTTSHNYYLRVVTNGKESLERIIENAAILPLETRRIFKTTVPNQKIVEILLFANAEDGTFEKQGTGFYVIKDNLPIDSELVFTFNMDVNQTLHVQVCPKGRVEIPTEIVLGRGDKDTKCLEKMSEVIKEVFSSDSIPESKKSEFVATIQKQIEAITQLGNARPSSSKWYDIEIRLEQTFKAAQEVDSEDNSELPFILAQILLNNFSKYIDRTDTNALQKLLKDYSSSTDIIKKQSILIEIREITDNYMPLISIFTIKIAADISDDPNISNQLAAYFDLAMQSLESHDFDSVISTSSKASPMVDTVFQGKPIPFGTGISK